MFCCKPPQVSKERLFFRHVELMLCQALNHYVGERPVGMVNGGFEFTWSGISIHNPASCGSRFEMSVRRSFDDKIPATTRTDSASPATVRAFFHSLLKSTTTASTV